MRNRRGALILGHLLILTFAFSDVAGARPADRDHDGLPDRWERRYELPVSARSARQDPDGDRLSNRAEYRRALHPRRPDTDRDGLSDRFEIRRSRTNPRRGDTDRDGMRDGAEVRRGRDPRRPDSHRSPVFQPVGTTPIVIAPAAHAPDLEQPSGGSQPHPAPTAPSPPPPAVLPAPSPPAPEETTAPPAAEETTIPPPPEETTVPPPPDETTAPPPPEETTVPPQPEETTVAMYVDRESRGGGCSDARGAAEATSPATPWCSIERAAEAAPPAALVVVRGGDYAPFVLRATREGELTLRAYPEERPVLRGASVQSRGVRVEGFRITGMVTLATGAAEVALVGNDWITDGQNGGTNLNLQAGVRDVLLEGNQISQEAGVLGANAINFNSTNTRAAIEDVTIRSNVIGPLRGGGDAIQAKNTRRLLIEDNEIYGVTRPEGSEAHPDVFQSIYGATDLVIRRNFIHDVAAQGIFVQEYLGENSNFRAEDNVIVRVAYPWQAFVADVNASSIVRNTIFGGLRVNGSAIEIIGNIATSNVNISASSEGVSEDFNLSPRFSAPPGPNSLVGAPAFVDSAANDFSLSPESLGKGAAPDGSDIGALRTVFPVR